MSNYTYKQQKIIPIVNHRDFYQEEEICSPISYSDTEEEYYKQNHYSNLKMLSSSNQIKYKNKKDLVNLIILIIFQNFKSKFNLNLNELEKKSFCNLFNLLITKCNSSLTNLMKNSLILEKILFNYSNNNNNNNNRLINFNCLKRMILISFIAGENLSNLNSIDFAHWSLITGISKDFLQNDWYSLIDSINICNDITENDLAHLNAILRYQVSNYVEVI
jgi:hypothetical protein